ncbi:MAG: hypothetical protein PHF14_03450, partial [Verrucomicrobiota bacterium]|nr:hypothetical protein [Verrucomicrobiota bacterium]
PDCFSSESWLVLLENRLVGLRDWTAKTQLTSQTGFAAGQNLFILEFEPFSAQRGPTIPAGVENMDH